jgi:hypothetical protein
MIVIGSKALLVQGIQTGRKSFDIDVIGEYDEIVDYAKKYHGNIRACYPIDDGKKLVVKTDRTIIEGELTWEGSSAEALRDLILADEKTIYARDTVGHKFASLDVLYLLKMSHRYKKNSPHFLKTMRDIQLMRKHGATIRPEHEAFYKQRMKDTYTYAHPKLDQTKKDFFNGDGVTYVYDHDSIHEAVKHLIKPAYTFYKPDESEVNCSREMFDAAPKIIRLYGGLEETYVLALERSQIPFGDLWSPKKSFDMALMKVCTSITSGWFREFCWEHYDEIQSLYDPEYVEKFWAKAMAGEVKPYNAEEGIYA